MSIEMYTYKFRLQPTRLQTILLNKHIGACRYCYNYFLNQRKINYQNYKQQKVDDVKFVNIKYKGSNYNDNVVELTQLKRVKETGWLKEVNTCSACGWINQGLTLKDRHWSCTQYTIKHDRDINASKNILKEGLRCISSRTGDYTHGANVSLHVIKQLVLKWKASMALV